MAIALTTMFGQTFAFEMCRSRATQFDIELVRTVHKRPCRDRCRRGPAGMCKPGQIVSFPFTQTKFGGFSTNLI
jgi:hypothetical protein